MPRAGTDQGTDQRPIHQPDEDRFHVITAHGPGTVLVLPSGQAHFHWAKSGEYITQVSAIGPLGLAYIDPANDPRNRSGTPPQ